MHIRLEPKELGEGYEFIDEIKGGVVPREFIPAVDKGIQEAMRAGVLAGYPVIDVRATLFDGSYHDVIPLSMPLRLRGVRLFARAVAMPGRKSLSR